MFKIMKMSLVVVFALFSPNAILADPESDGPVPLLREMQETIANLFANDAATAKAAAERIKQLRSEGTAKSKQLFPDFPGLSGSTYFSQFIYFSASGTTVAERKAWLFALEEEAFPNVSRGTAAYTLALMLDLEEPDDPLQGVVRDALGWLDKHESKEDRPQILIYQRAFETLEFTEDATHRSAERQLLRYLHRIVDPRDAMYSFLRTKYVADIKKDRYHPILELEHAVYDCLWRQQWHFLEKEHVCDPASDALTELVKREEWWVQLYVIGVMLHHPEFVSQPLIDRLLKSEEEQVRQEVRFLQQTIRERNEDEDGRVEEKSDTEKAVDAIQDAVEEGDLEEQPGIVRID